MDNLPVYDVIARAFVAEGVDTHFTVMGDANMFWAANMTAKHSVRTIHARHENCACTMAIGYARATGKVGIASVTCGPGFTQIMTALTVAARGNIPLVVFAGEMPLTSTFGLQRLDHGPLAVATGAHFLPVRHVDRVLDNVREAFYIAQFKRQPVVLSVPMDLQKQSFPFKGDYTPSAELLPAPQRISPDPAMVRQAVDMIAAAKRPIIIAGRGVMKSGAREAVEALAERSGALLATTLLAKGLFDGNPFHIGIAGYFQSKVGRELFSESDLVIGIGAALGYQTTEAGGLYRKARVINIDINPRSFGEGMRIADFCVQADARTAVESILAELATRRIPAAGFRSPVIANRIASETTDSKTYTVAAGTLDPRAILRELDNVIPKDWEIVVGLGHFFTFVLAEMGGRAPERWHVITDFGTIGSALSAAIGVAATRSDGKVLLIDGDGSMLMHIQELETIQRHNLRLLMCVMNDGGYGSEVHKFRANGWDPAELFHGRGHLAEVTKSFGLQGETVTSLNQLESLFRRYQASDTAALWDLHVDDAIPSAQYRRMHYGEVS